MQFRNVSHALQWSFQIVGTPILKGSSVFSMMPSSGRNGSELTSHDRHAQAALILGMVERLADVNQKAWIVAQYGKVFKMREHSAGDPRLSVEQKAAVEMANAVEMQLVKAVMASFGTGMHSTRGVSKLVRNYFGASIGVNAIRTDLKCSHSAVPEWKDRVYSALDRIEANIENTLENEMAKQGLIEVAICA